MERIIKGWLSVWLYVICTLGGALAALLITNWSAWGLSAKCCVFSMLSLILHVMEE